MKTVYAIARVVDDVENYVRELNSEDAYTDDIGNALLFKELKLLPDLQGFDEYYVKVSDNDGELDVIGKALKFTKVFTKDWNGVSNLYNVTELIDKGDGKYSCTFKNSSGDIEKKLVTEQDLFQS